MKNKMTVIAILTATTITLCCCNRASNINVLGVNPVMIDYMGFAKKGSYWIYRDTVSGMYDTLTVVDYIGPAKLNCYYEMDGKKIYADKIQFDIATTFRKQEFTYYVESDCDIIGQANTLIDFGPALGQIKATVNTNNNFIHITERSEEGDSIIATLLPSVVVNGVTYSNVYYFDCTKEIGYYSHYDYWYSLKNGIVRFKNEQNNENWILVSKNIVQ